MARVITFGEIMLRLKSPALERFFQSPSLEATFGGGEANVAVSLANYGMDAAFVTALPNNAIGEACRRDVRSFGVDVSNIKMTDGRMGIYFLETGSNQRPSKVVYDRADSAIAIAPIDLFDWEKIFEGADWFHISGIAPAISASAAELSLAACKAAKKCGVKVSCDLNYRKNLWKYGKEAKEVMSEIAKYIDVAIANEEDFQKSLGITADSDVESGSLDRNVYEGIAKKALEKNSTETTWIPAGDHGDVLPTDVKNAKAAISADGKYTIVSFNVNPQTDGPKESSSKGPVGRSIGTLGNVQNALDELPGVSVTSGMENIKLTYNDAYVRDVKIDNATGKIISGTWHYKVNVNVNNLGVKVVGIPASIDTLTGIVDYTVKIG